MRSKNIIIYLKASVAVKKKKILAYPYSRLFFWRQMAFALTRCDDNGYWQVPHTSELCQEVCGPGWSDLRSQNILMCIFLVGEVREC